MFLTQEVGDVFESLCM